MKLTNQHVAILGAGRSGRAAARLAMREGARVSVWDCVQPKVAVEMPEGVEVHYAVESAPADFEADFLVVSPGIDSEGVFAKPFALAAGSVVGEVEFASWFYDGTIVGITGTNGKTTTTELVSRILAHAGMGGVACGNYGLPFSEVVIDGGPAAVSLELSSFQLETIRSLHPKVAVWMNFSPDHMDRYATVDAYRAAKLRIFENVADGDFVVARAGEGLPETGAPVVEFSTEDPTVEWFSDGNDIRCRGELVMRMEEVTLLRGRHNAENVMAAFAVGRALGLSLAVMVEAVAGYCAPPHRCELVRTLAGVDYLNDSKATNEHALISALRSQTRPVVLVAGGKDKGLDYSGMMPLLGEKVLYAATFGEIAKPLADLIAAAVPVESVTTLVDAVGLARAHAPEGAVVLFSPGTSSFDQFEGYEHRGEAFRKAVEQLN